MKKRVAVLGGGFTGLTTAYQLSQQNLDVYLFEKEKKAGGLAAGFKKKEWRWSVENSYHHFFTSDKKACDLAQKLNLKIIFKKTLTANFTHQRILPLDSPLSLFTFPYLNFWDKIRTGLSLAYLRLTPFWQRFEKDTAERWLIKTQGMRAWRELWQPLFLGKFGKYYQQIAMRWFWARIKKRSALLGYPEGGFQVLIDRLITKTGNYGGKIFCGYEIKEAWFNGKTWRLKIKDKLGKFLTFEYDFLVSTLPTGVFIKIFPQLSSCEVDRLKKIKHLHALTIFMELTKPFLPVLDKNKPVYWLNITDPSFPFLALVEHTNFMEKKNYANHHLIYIGNYLTADHHFFKMSKKDILNVFIPYLKKINPYFSSSFILDSKLLIGYFAQPIVTVNYSKIRPELTTSLPNLYFGNLDSVYPWDRGVNYAIELGYKLADLILTRLQLA